MRTKRGGATPAISLTLIYVMGSGCGRSENATRPEAGLPPTSADVGGDNPIDSPADRPPLLPPGSLPGWEEQRDGIVCRHPPAHGDCEGGWCRIPAGCFGKGSPLEEPGRALYAEDQVAVVLTHDFLIQQHEMTQGEWTAMGLPNPSGPSPKDNAADCTEDPKCPVGNVTWFEAAQFANMLSAAHQPPLPTCYRFDGCIGEMGAGMSCASASLATASIYECEGYRLPTDAEWEYAARAGTRTSFYTGDITPRQGDYCYGSDPALEAIAWYCNNAGRKTHPAGTKLPNSWMLYDMLGNVDEWIHSPQTGDPPPPGPLYDPGGAISQKDSKMQCGGSATGWPTLLRAANRLSFNWRFRNPLFGFRLLRSLPRPTTPD